SLGFLVGDVDGSRSTNAGDVSNVKARAGQAVDSTNLRFDLNANGIVSAADIAAVKARSGRRLP
ncbi:MAG: hypothetical protein JNN20_00095, partial [Betaproteobacteria bacterium]|nr:hypothetical protein [Betaproteobacteria bacterium]